jgi:GTP-binding protein Era
MNQQTKSGFVAIIGRPNSGKSTLLNSLIEFKLSIVTPKAQTTRKRVAGIYSTDNTQIVFLDTPGIIKPDYEMQKSMMTYVQSSLEEADALVILVDASTYDIERGFDNMILQYLNSFKNPKILLLNKTDKLSDKKLLLPLMSFMQNTGYFTDIIPISAKTGDNLQLITETIEKYLPEGDFYYDPEQLSTENQRFFVSELIREQVFFRLNEEVPYSIEVLIAEFKERENGKWYISAEIVVERDSQKKIVVGKQGTKIKEIGLRARKEIERHLGTEVYLELFVKVKNDWRNNKNMLRSFGY